MQQYLLQLFNSILFSIPNLFTALIILILSLYLARWLSDLLRKAMLRRKSSPGVTHLLAQTLRWTLITFGVIAALQRFFNVTAF